MAKDDILIVTELSRIGRSLMEVMSILHQCMEQDIKVFTTKINERYELGNNISSQVLAFAFGLSAQIERDMISQRTKEALARKKSEGKILGRPKGSQSKETKLMGKEDEIRGLLEKKVPIRGQSTKRKILYVKTQVLRISSATNSIGYRTYSKNGVYGGYGWSRALFWQKRKPDINH